MTLRLRLLIRFRPVLRFIKTRILHVDDSPERIARGIAVGFFTAWLPLFGLHIPLSLIFAAILRANKAMALLFVWVSNPLTALFIYYPTYRVGRFALGFFRETPTVQPEQMQSMFAQVLSVKRIFLEFFTVDLWKQFWDVFTHAGLEMLIGGVLLGLIVAKASYWASLTLIKRFRDKRRRRQSMRVQ
ncbi:MAG: DUF2062 domain-containing protein [Phycisphaerae bacterium]|nr:DUF2062 domain-containing protein [Phycisphaerae bacterium]